MKTRRDFITNSSSASFVIPKFKLTQEQLDAIWNHYEIAEDLQKKSEIASCNSPLEALVKFGVAVERYLAAKSDCRFYNDDGEVVKLDLINEYVSKLDSWKIEEINGCIHGSTFMDNFSMRHFMDIIGVNPNDAKWDDDWY